MTNLLDSHFPYSMLRTNIHMSIFKFTDNWHFLNAVHLNRMVKCTVKQ